jgi:hypothetical protein
VRTKRKRFQTIANRFAGFQAQSLNVPVDFPLLQCIALPVTPWNPRKLSLRITLSEVKSPLRAVRKRPERAVPDIFLRVG